MSDEMQTDTPQPAAQPPEAERTTAAEVAAAPEEETGAPSAEVPPAEDAIAVEAMVAEGAPAVEPAIVANVAIPPPPPRGDRPPREPRADRPPREPRADRPPRDRDRPQGQAAPGDRAATTKTGPGGSERRGPEQRSGGSEQRAGGGDRPRDAGQRGNDRDRRPEVRRPEGPVEIEYEKLIGDSLYLDNQAHVLVARLRDLDAGTRSQLRRLYGAVRRACRAPETDRQHQFVMLRARLAYTIARHGLRSLDPLEKLLLQVTRRNETRGYDRFRDLFEAIIAYNE
jgi:CRISPR type III-A-associated protein Csm2